MNNKSENKSPKQTIVDLDPYLETYRDVILDRKNNFEKKLTDIAQQYGSLEKYASWHHKMGFHWDGDSFVYREWAPKAQHLHLVGDFNNWKRGSAPLTQKENGIWEYRCKASDIPHNSEVKVTVESDIGIHDRLPTFITYTKQNPTNHSFNGVFWNPNKAFVWTDKDFKPQNDTLFIYEAHVGMATEEHKVGTFREFADKVLPYIADIGYNTVQLMAVMEHPYYASFGYHVSNIYAISSRFGSPEDFKYLVNKAHTLGLALIMDVIHSHAIKNFHEGLFQFDGTEYQFFHAGPKGYHKLWDSKLYDYAKEEVQRYLLSNLRFWLEEYHIDGFRFDGITSMLYHHHGQNKDFVHYDMYFGDEVDKDALLYLQLANELTHSIAPKALTIAEDMSGMPGLCRPMCEAGIGFDYRLAMGIPDNWIKLLKEKQDEDWDFYKIYCMLTDRRPAEKSIAYCESHDQAIVGDKTIAFRLMDKEMYWHMKKNSLSPVIDRGIALHKMIRFVTSALGGESYLSFMGNEFGHPEWIDFPREGNNFSYQHARRQWSLKDNEQLSYSYLLQWDIDMLQFINKYAILKDSNSRVIVNDVDNAVLVFEKSGLLFVCSFNPTRSIPSYRIGVPCLGSYKIVLNSDDKIYGGFGRIDTSILYDTSDTPMHGQNQSLELYVTNRTICVLRMNK